MFRKFMLFILLVFVAMGVAFAMGPTEKPQFPVKFDETKLGSDLNFYLIDRERKVANLTSGADKQIVWHGDRDAKTPLAIVYIHGYSATLEEVRPLPDIIAQELGANLFYTRLSGHGRDGDAMAEATADKWMQDVAEALAIGRRIGEKVIVVSTSTGGTLATLAASRAEMNKDMIGMVLLSPNYAIQAPGAFILSLPWARRFLPILAGTERSFEARNEEHRKWWTTRYPVEALVPMQSAIDAVNNVAFENLTIPSLFIFHPSDPVVKSDVTRDIVARWGKSNGTAAESMELSRSSGLSDHVIAGRILNPDNSQPLANKAIEWIRAL